MTSTRRTEGGGSPARVTWIGGPVLHAQTEGEFRVNEAVEIGPQRLLGEVLQIRGKSAVIQVYEDTTGLRPGTRVQGTGQPLAVTLGPGLLGRIFDGLLRPLQQTEGPYLRPGMYSAEPAEFPFEPGVSPGDELSGGAAFGTVSPERGLRQKVLLPPDIGGTVQKIAPAGSYREDQILLTLQTEGGDSVELSMSQRWPVRRPRPVGQRLPLHAPLLTGQRIIDGLFPVARGGKAAMPGGFGTGKTVLQQNLAKWCDADVIVYIGCGERGNEMTAVLHEFPELEDPRTGRRLIERSVIIANTSNMPVAAREASIYTGVTVAEYFRDQGLDAALMADSTSRWAEALREISGRLGELPAEGGYPAYLSSRKADLAAWWRDQEHPERERQRQRFLGLLEEQARLERMARIVGKEALPARQQLTLLCAELLNDAFLRQNAFSTTDRYTSPRRQIAMMRTLDQFFDRAEQAVELGVAVTEIQSLPLLRRLRRMGEDIPEEQPEGFEDLQHRLDEAFAELGGEPAGRPGAAARFEDAEADPDAR